jgi:hypothetical protein
MLSIARQEDGSVRYRLKPFRLLQVDNSKYTSHKQFPFSQFREPAVGVLDFKVQNVRRVATSATSPHSKRKLADLEDETDSNSRRLKQHRPVEVADNYLLAKSDAQLEINDCLNEEMSEYHLWLITNSYDNLLEWKDLAASLGLSQQEIQLIESRFINRDGLKECFYQTLLKWRIKEPENCTFANFFQILSVRLSKNADFLASLTKSVSEFVRKSELDEFKSERPVLKSYLASLMSKAKKQRVLKSEFESDLALEKVKLEERILWRASELICQEWKSIARALALTESTIFQIESKHLLQDGLRECCYQSLISWSQSLYEKANLEHVCLSLIHASFNLYARQFLEIALFD